LSEVPVNGESGKPAKNSTVCVGITCLLHINMVYARDPFNCMRFIIVAVGPLINHYAIHIYQRYLILMDPRRHLKEIVHYKYTRFSNIFPSNCNYVITLGLL